MLLELLALSRSADRAFSSIPYVGTGAVRVLGTGVDLTHGGLTILRQQGNNNAPAFYDTVRGATERGLLYQNADTVAALAFSGRDRIFLGSNYNVGSTDYVAWNFRKKAKFLDIVTFTGGGGAVSHALGETPKLIIVLRRTGSVGNTRALHWIPGESEYMYMSALASGTPFTSVSSSSLTPASMFTTGETYVAYLFGTGSGELAVGEYTGAVNAGVVTTQPVTLPFTPSWGMIWGGYDPTVPNAADAQVYDRLLAGPSGNHMEGLGQVLFAGTLPVTVAGTTLTASSVSGTKTACLTGSTYRYLLVR